MILQEIRKNKTILSILIICNILAFLYGLDLYLDNISDYQWYLWIFLNLSPLYILIITINLFFLLIEKPVNKAFTVFSFSGVLALGIASLFFYPIFMFLFNISKILIMLWIGHVFLGLEAILIIEDLKKLRLFQYILIFLWYLLTAYISITKRTFIYFIYGFPYKITLSIAFLIIVLLLLAYSYKKTSYQHI